RLSVSCRLDAGDALRPDDGRVVRARRNVQAVAGTKLEALARGGQIEADAAAHAVEDLVRSRGYLGRAFPTGPSSSLSLQLDRPNFFRRARRAIHNIHPSQSISGLSNNNAGQSCPTREATKISACKMRARGTREAAR